MTSSRFQRSIFGHGPQFFADIGTFAVPLPTYVLTKTHMKWVPRNILDKEAVHSMGYI